MVYSQIRKCINRSQDSKILRSCMTNQNNRLLPCMGTETRTEQIEKSGEIVDGEQLIPLQ